VVGPMNTELSKWQSGCCDAPVLEEDIHFDSTDAVDSDSQPRVVAFGSCPECGKTSWVWWG
jgi:hypothetical protein